MARSTPTIDKNTLIAHEGERALEIAVGSAAWFEWVGRESSTLFAFHVPEGGYTARKEGSGSRRGGWYWKAYRKHQGRLYRAYMGKAEDLTLMRLKEIEQARSALIAAGQLSDERIGQTALAQISQSARLPFAQSPLRTALAFLLNDLSRFVQEGVVVLEDYHLIEHAQIHEMLAFFIEHLPASLRVIILTRSLPPLPLVRWRARGDLLELQTTQLRFSLEEMALFLQQILPQAPAKEPLHAFNPQLQSWASGLRV